MPPLVDYCMIVDFGIHGTNEHESTNNPFMNCVRSARYGRCASFVEEQAKKSIAESDNGEYVYYTIPLSKV